MYGMEGLGPTLWLDKLGDQVRVDLIRIGLAAMTFALAGTVAQAAADTGAPLNRVSLGTDSLSSGTQANSESDRGLTLDNSGGFWGKLHSSTLDLTDKLHARLTQVSLDPDRDLLQMPQALALSPVDRLPRRVQTSPTELTAASLDWNATDWGSLGLTASTSTTAVGLTGDLGFAPLSAASFTDNTTTAGMAARVKLGDGWVTSFSYNVGITQLSLRDGGALANGDGTVQSRSYGVAIAKHGLFGERDSLGLSVSRRTEDYFGNVSLAGLDDHVNLLSNYRRVSLGGDGETDLALGYVTTFLNGALALQANAGYQMNVAGQNGSNSLTVLSRAKINF